MPRTEYPLLADIAKSFEPLTKLWQMAGAFTRRLPDWMDGPFTEIEAGTVAADVEK
jgi:dynein heavy chain